MAIRSIERLRNEIRELRRLHGRNVHLSRTIRESAVNLAAKHGPGVYERVGIHLQSVKRWERLYPSLFNAAVAPAVEGACDNPSKEKIGFIELKAAPEPLRKLGWPEHAASVVEVARPDGWVLRMSGELAEDFVRSTIGKFSF